MVQSSEEQRAKKHQFNFNILLIKIFKFRLVPFLACKNDVVSYNSYCNSFASKKAYVMVQLEKDESRQHVHTKSAQSTTISISGVKHNKDGIVPVNALFPKFK